VASRPLLHPLVGDGLTGHGCDVDHTENLTHRFHRETSESLARGRRLTQHTPHAVSRAASGALVGVVAHRPLEVLGDHLPLPPARRPGHPLDTRPAHARPRGNPALGGPEGEPAAAGDVGGGEVHAGGGRTSAVTAGGGVAPSVYYSDRAVKLSPRELAGPGIGRMEGVSRFHTHRHDPIHHQTPCFRAFQRTGVTIPYTASQCPARGRRETPGNSGVRFTETVARR
jgi:hypothetical protein